MPLKLPEGIKDSWSLTDWSRVIAQSVAARRKIQRWTENEDEKPQRRTNLSLSVQEVLIALLYKADLTRATGATVEQNAKLKQMQLI